MTLALMDGKYDAHGGHKLGNPNINALEFTVPTGDSRISVVGMR